ncbi:MAG: TSUP family transporter [Solimonas sp.]
MGVGAGSLMTPILASSRSILFCGIKPATAVGTEHLYASIGKAFGVALRRRKGMVNWKRVAWRSAGSMPATFIR